MGQNGMCESSLIEPPPVESRMATTDCMHQVDEQQIAQALARARLVHERELQAQQQPAALVSSLCCEPNKGPYGPYNPCPSYMLGVQSMLQAQQPAAQVSSLCSEPNKGPYGPYNPCPSYMLGVQSMLQAQQPAAQVSSLCCE